MSFGDLGNKAQDALNSEKGEQVSDQGLDKAQDAASGVGGGKFDDQVQKGRDAADQRVGDDGADEK